MGGGGCEGGCEGRCEGGREGGGERPREGECEPGWAATAAVGWARAAGWVRVVSGWVTRAVAGWAMAGDGLVGGGGGDPDRPWRSVRTETAPLCART